MNLKEELKKLTHDNDHSRAAWILGVHVTYKYNEPFYESIFKAIKVRHDRDCSISSDLLDLRYATMQMLQIHAKKEGWQDVIELLACL